MSDERALEIGNAFREQGVEISVHAPYYINFANPDEEMAEINTLINCLNLVVNQVASEYFILKDKVKVNSVNGVIYYSQLSNKVVSDILNHHSENTSLYEFSTTT